MEPLYFNTLAEMRKDTSVYNGTPLFQHPEMRTPLYTVELLDIPTPWNEDTTVYSEIPLFKHPEMEKPKSCSVGSFMT